MATASMTDSIRRAEVMVKTINLLQSMDGKEYSFEYDERTFWEKLLRKPKRMKKVIYEVSFEMEGDD